MSTRFGLRLRGFPRSRALSCRVRSPAQPRRVVCRIRHARWSLSLVTAALGCGRTSLIYDDAAGGSGGVEACLDYTQEHCYEGPASTENVGACKPGVRTCKDARWGECDGQVLPAVEVCDGIDNDCNGIVDDPCPCPLGQERSCYSGPPSTQNIGSCRAGTQTCELTGWGPCVGEVLPTPEVCDGADTDCNGVIDDPCPCPLGHTQPCYSGPPGTAGNGQCKAGSQTCTLMGWTACEGEVLPSPDVCDLVDNNCGLGCFRARSIRIKTRAGVTPRHTTSVSTICRRPAATGCRCR